MIRPLLAWLALALLAAPAAAQSAATRPATGEVVVLTSFPKELFEAYKQAFERRTPGVKVVVKQQQTNQGVTYLRETRARPEADVFWVSAVDAFQTLQADGLLDPARKRSLPRHPRRVAVITSRDGAALRDIFAVVQRRCPSVEIVLVPAAVQGDAAPESLC